MVVVGNLVRARKWGGRKVFNVTVGEFFPTSLYTSQQKLIDQMPSSKCSYLFHPHHLLGYASYGEWRWEATMTAAAAAVVRLPVVKERRCRMRQAFTVLYPLSLYCILLTSSPAAGACGL